MTVFTRQIALATRLLRKYGEACKHIDQETGIVTEGVKVAWFPSAQLTNFELTFNPQQAIPNGHIYGIMEAGLVVPKLHDTIRRSDGNDRQITSADTLAPDGTSILHYLYCEL